MYNKGQWVKNCVLSLYTIEKIRNITLKKTKHNYSFHFIISVTFELYINLKKIISYIDSEINRWVKI